MRKKTSQIIHLRKDYSRGELDEKKVNKNPFIQFETWLGIALQADLYEPYATNLSTADKKGKPSARIVLLRGINKDGFIFYTNYLSRKGRELEQNPFAAMTFFWSELEKQVRIEGRMVKVSKAISDEYFRNRPRQSQIGAWVSAQSIPISGRMELDNNFNNLTKKFEGKTIPRPKNWGGFCLIAGSFEFWQGRPNRLHDRILYKKIKNNTWKILRLAP